MKLSKRYVTDIINSIEFSDPPVETVFFYDEQDYYDILSWAKEQDKIEKWKPYIERMLNDG